MKKKIEILNSKITNFLNKYLYNISGIRNLCFFAGFSILYLYLIRYCVNSIKFEQQTLDLLCGVFVALFIFKIIITKEKPITYLKYIVLFTITLICDNQIGEMFVTYILLCLVAAKKIELRKILKFLFILNLGIICFCLTSYVLKEFLNLNVLPKLINRVLIRDNGVIRQSIYFSHPNIFSAFVFWTYTLYVYLNFNNIKTKYFLLSSFIIAFSIYIITNSNCATILFILAPLLFVLFKNKKLHEKKIFKWTSICSFAIIFAISIGLLIAYNSSTPIGLVAKKIDNLVNGRINIASRYLQEYGLSIIGTKMTETSNMNVLGQKKIVLDNLYYYLIIRNGFIIVMGYIYYFTKTCYYCFQKREYDKLYIIMLFSIYNFIESIGKVYTLPISFPFFFLVPFI